MAIIAKCNCNFELCKFPQHMRNTHVDDKCVHASGISHKLVKEVVEVSTNYRLLESSSSALTLEESR